MLTVREIKARTESFFAARGVPDPKLDADSLIARALGLKRLELYLDLDRPFTERQLDELRSWVKRRGGREPLQHITGVVEFMGLRLKVDRRALIPRPETEELAEAVMERLGGGPRRVLDLGTGSGALALAFAARWPEAEVTAVDRSAEALDLARENARTLDLGGRVCFLRGDWYEPVAEGARFDLVVANPPYLTEAELASAEAEVREYEPAAALVAGPDGMDALRVLIAGASRRLEAGGLLALETGVAQHVELSRLSESAGLRGEGAADLSGRPRFFFARPTGVESACGGPS